MTEWTIVGWGVTFGAAVLYFLNLSANAVRRVRAVLDVEVEDRVYKRLQAMKPRRPASNPSTGGRKTEAAKKT